jgi:RNA polymerase I-specific transcription initiation factor RRN5
VYPDNPNKVDDEKFIPPSGPMPIKEDRTEERIEEAGQSGNVATIPEAKLLDPQVMLTLSREIFMNRSPDFPSPWLHWSHYTSEIASEPSIYRTAFNDFHRLAVSITKRLVQVAIIQATSRLRAQRVRNKKGLLPFVKRRDVYTAIDVLRMERNGSERWRGVARRCGLKVISSKTAPGGRRQRQLSVPWAEVERITSPSIGLNERSSWEPETSIEPENFKLRAFRSGTPLPMHNLTLSDGDNDGDIEYVTDIDSEQSSVAPSDSQTSGSPDIPSDDSVHHDNTLEEFDQEARRLEEQALFNMLGLDPVSQKDSTTTGDVEEDADSEVDEKVTTLPDDWRRSLEYQPTWETYRRPVAFAKFSKNRKTASPMPAANTPRETSTRSPSGNLSDASSPNGPTRSMQKLPLPVELRARSTNAYAALQRGAWENEREEDIPTQSIEAGPDESDIGRLVSDMDCA